MEKVKGVIGSDCRPSIKEIFGEVTFVQSISRAYGSCLELKLDPEHPKPIWWQHQDQNPLIIRVGDYLRGFYEDSPGSNATTLEAYEISDSRGNVLGEADLKDVLL